MPRTPVSGHRLLKVDPRLLIGVGLVVASVAGVAGLVAAVDTRETVYVAASHLAPGERIEQSDLVGRSLSLEGSTQLYLGPGDLPENGLVAVHAVGKGELVPRSAVGDDVGMSSTALVIESESRVSSRVQPGSIVEVWATPADPGTGRAPAVLVQSAVVTGVIDDDGLVSDRSGAAVEVQVERGRLARLLQALADGDLLSVVPAGLPLEQ